MKRLAIGLSVALCCIGCDRVAVEPVVADANEAVPPASGADAADPTAPAGVASSGLSAGYLAGPWCYLYFEGGGERNDERIDHVFNEDGTLLYQDSPEAPLDSPGSWKLDGNTLSILPALAMSADIQSVADDRFVLGFGMMRAVFARGACARQPADPPAAGMP